MAVYEGVIGFDLVCLQIQFINNNHMGQNNSMSLNISNVIKEWIVTENDPTILINKKTKQHLQCYQIDISSTDLLREVPIYNARIQAIYPYVCKIAYFNQLNNAPITKGYHRFAVYTDHLFFIRDYQWSIPRFIDVLQAVLTLTSYYGYFKLTEKMIFVNERGQTKVWISQNPVNNHRDFAFTSQEQAVAAFAGLATLKNYEVANLLIGCTSLKDAFSRLKKPRRKRVGQFNNLSHYEDKGSKKGFPMSFYRPMKEEKINNINLELHIGIKNEDIKHYSTYQKAGKAVSSRSVSHCKRSFINQQSKKNVFLNTHGNHSHSKNNQSMKVYPSMQLQKSVKFQGSPKMRPTTQLSSKSTLFGQKKQDITIINNNVSHVVNNIMHSHPLEKTFNNEYRHIREARTPQFVADSIKMQSSSPSQKKEKINVPFFIQKKNRQRQDSFNYNKTQFYDKGYSDLAPSKFSMTNQDSLHHSAINLKNSAHFDMKGRQTDMKGRQTDISKQRNKNTKLYTFFKPASQIRQNMFNKSFSPQSKAPSSYIQNKNFTQFLKKPNRTFTTDFNDLSYGKEIEKKSKNVSFNKIIPQEITQYASAKSIQIRSIPSQNDQDANLKKQLKLQFSHLLGTQTKIQASQKESRKQIVHQNSLKQKIQQKKMAFAELKKEALAVLTDLF